MTYCKPCREEAGVKVLAVARTHGRLRLWECACPRPVKVRVASDDFRATCDTCGSPFERR